MANAGIHLVNTEGKEEQGFAQESSDCEENAADDKNKQNSSKKRGESARTKVRIAQFKVLEKLNDIVDSNLGSAAQGNHNCAKFMLDWSGVSDLRSPLARLSKQRSVARDLLKQLKKTKPSKKKSRDAK